MGVKSAPIFVDSDALIALLKIDDSNHELASQLFALIRKNGRQTVISNVVFAEVVTILSQRVSRQAALAFIDIVRAKDSDLLMLFISQDVHNLATTLFKKQKSKNVSFVDCTNMALVTMLHCEAILSFDHVYRQNKIPMFTLE